MDTLYCDVIGCEREAEWVRSMHIAEAQAEFLCHICWAHLQLRDPQEASYYVPYKEAVAASRKQGKQHKQTSGHSGW